MMKPNCFKRYVKRYLTSAIILLLTLGLFQAVHAKAPDFFQQNKTVKGKITDELKTPLSGVSVIQKGTTNGAVTSPEGDFSITVPEGAVLVVTSIGFNGQEITVGAANTINLQMKSLPQHLTDVVVVGYATQKKVTVTGAVSAIKGENLVKSPAVDLSNSLAGRLPGLVVIQTSGEPGYDGATVKIRGTNTIGNSDPLIVIDGVPERDGGLGRLNPRDIENISVLKDASAAIYGSRSANGVILITTKKGATSKPRVTYDFNHGWNQPARIPEMSNAFEYANIMNELPIYKTIPAAEWGAAWTAIQTSGTYDSPTPGVSTLNANYSPTAVQKHKDGSDPWGYPDTDWFDDAFKTWSPQVRHNLQISGGSDNFRYFTSIGYVEQDAYYHNSATKYQQYNFRTNLTAKVNNYISTNIGIMVRREERRFPTASAGAIFRMLMRGRPTEPEVWPDRGQYGGPLPGPDIENGENPYVITTNATGYNDNPTDYMQANGSVDITNPWVKGLKLTLSGAVDKNNETEKIWQTPWMLYYWDRVTYEDDGVTPKLVGAIRSNFTDPRLTQQYASKLNTNLTAILSYDRKIGADHTINLLAGVTKEIYKGETFVAFRRNYISSAIDQLFAGGATQTASNDLSSPSKLYERPRLGYYGRVQYNYKEKYLAEFVWRYDGSYMFPEDKRFGFFPGILLGWNISNEDFFNVEAINYLKLRASYGQMGNDQIVFGGVLQEFKYLSTYDFGRYPINSAVATTLRETVLENPDFTWEESNNYNIGLDASLFNNKVDLTLEYFTNQRKLLFITNEAQTPASAGLTLPPVNKGQLDNTGFEFSVGYNGKIGADWIFKAGINGGYAKNTVVKVPEIAGVPEYQLYKGHPFEAYLVYKSAGVFIDQEDINKNTIDYSEVTSNIIPGDMKFEDVDGDGKITGDDQVRMDKNNTPTFNYGATFELRYKGFDLNILFQGASGALMYVVTESGDIGNFLKYSHDNRWSVDNPSSEHPRLASRGDTYYTGGAYGNNTYFLFNKNYFRLKNIELGYNFPSNVLNKVSLANLRLFVNGLNVFTVDKMKVFDPEATAVNGVYYPQARVINAGFVLTF